MPREKGLYLTKRILRAYPNGFCGAIIEGPRGIGKSSFALNVGYEVYRNLGYEKKDAWDKTLEVCKFGMEEVIEFIEGNITKDDKAHLLIWDDAGVYASSMEWWTNRTMLKRLKAVADTIRTGVCSILITTPSAGSLTKILRDYDDYIVQITYAMDKGSSGRYRMANGYLKRTLPSGTKRVYTKFKDKYYCMLPDGVFEKYMEKRNEVLKTQVTHIKEMFNDPKK